MEILFKGNSDTGRIIKIKTRRINPAMDRFLQHDDELGRQINAAAAELYVQMQGLDAGRLGMPDHCLAYYQASHSRRLFFSIETSAHLLYRAITLAARPPRDLVIMDYGAGVGSLYLLAKRIGSTVVYNDHLDDWRLSAQLIAEALNITIDEYIVGDIDDCLARLSECSRQCDIITSRNVIEHIYRLDRFYQAIHLRQPHAMVYSSTTANKQNPASRLKHRRWHHKWEQVYLGKRTVLIERQAPGLSSTKIQALGKATRGLAGDELTTTIEAYRKNGRMPDVSHMDSNTCDPANGVWAEHLIGTSQYRSLIDEDHYTVSFAPGFWDTHYSRKAMNRIARILNRIIARGGRAAMTLAPFMYVIALPRKDQ